MLVVNGPSISVVLPVRDGARYVREAVDSILEQTLRDLELVVVDDGSADETPEVLSSFRDPRLRIVRQGRLGLVEALNRGLRETRAPLVARMDADDVSLPARLERQVAVLRDRPRVGLVATWLTVIDESGNETGMEVVPDRDADLRRRLLLRNSFKHGSVVFRREALERAGGYRADYGNNEDYDLWRRIAASYELACVPEPLYRYREHALGVSRTSALERIVLRERLRDELWAAFRDSEYRVLEVVRSGTHSDPRVARDVAADQRAIAREALARRRYRLAAKALAASLALGPREAARGAAKLVRRPSPPRPD